MILKQRQAARPRTLMIPLYSVTASDDSELFLVSKTRDVTLVDLFAFTDAGQQLYLGREVLPSSRSVRLSLRERLADAGAAFQIGYLRLDYTGDPAAIQAWCVVRSGKQSFEIPPVSPETAAASEFLSFWDLDLAGPRPKLRAEYRIINTTDQPVEYSLSISRGDRAVSTESVALPPHSVKAVVVSNGETARRGWLRLSHSGSPGAIIGGGFLASEEWLTYMPLLTPASARNGPRFDVIRLPDASSLKSNGKARSVVALFNSSDAKQAASVDVVDQTNGAQLSTTSVTIDPWRVEDVEISPLLGSAASGVRLRIRASTPSLAVQGVTVTAAGECLEMSVHSSASAHRSGTYPIPALKDFETVTTIVNIGDSPAEIVAQYFWDGGMFAVPIFSVPSGGASTIEPSRLAASGTKDMLERKLDASGRHMALKWSVRSGSEQLIGRTDVRPIGGDDRFGFNCGSCCWQIPTAEMIPFEVELDVGDSVSLEPTVYFDTCSGRMGPWYSGAVSTDVPSPFTWDTYHITTSDGADDLISFSIQEEEIDYGCLISRVNLSNSAAAKACQKVFNPQNYNKDIQCVQQTSNCNACNGCCNALYAMKICQKYNGDTARGERDACLTNCFTDRCS